MTLVTEGNSLLLNVFITGSSYTGRYTNFLVSKNSSVKNSLRL
jgi:hypothetical protein